MVLYSKVNSIYLNALKGLLTGIYIFPGPDRSPSNLPSYSKLHFVMAY